MKSLSRQVPTAALAALTLLLVAGCGGDGAADGGAATDVQAASDTGAGAPGDDTGSPLEDVSGPGTPKEGDAIGTADAAGDVADDVAEQPQTVWLAPPPLEASDDDRLPRDVHLTWEGSPATSITVQWRTLDIDLDSYRPLVWFARADEAQGSGDALALPFDEAHTVAGEGVTYVDYMGGGDTYVQWTVALTDLAPETDYVYVAGTWDDFDRELGEFVAPNLSAGHTFHTGVPKGERKPFRFISAGDSRGGYEGIQANIGHMRDLGADFWLFNGDMNETDKRREWASWFDAMAPVLDESVLMPVQGNHEFLAWTYYELFALPREPDLPDDMKEHAWSFDYANVHFVGLNSSLAVEKQNAWVEADLAAASEDPDIDWIVVLFHHAAYSSSNHGSNVIIQKNWVPIFEKYGVDVVFNGHDHNYERTLPVRADAVAEDGDGIVYVVAGAFFAPPYDNGHEWFTATSTAGDVANYTVVDVDGDTFHVVAYSGDGAEVLDDFTLQK